MLSGKSNDPTVIVASARPGGGGCEPRLAGPVQAAHSAASARQATKRTLRCLGIVTPCLGIFPIMRLPLRAGQCRRAGTIAPDVVLSLRQANIHRASAANHQWDAGRMVR